MRFAVGDLVRLTVRDETLVDATGHVAWHSGPVEACPVLLVLSLRGTFNDNVIVSTAKYTTVLCDSRVLNVWSTSLVLV